MGTGTIKYSENPTLLELYNIEKGYEVIRGYGSPYCTDEVERITNWNGKMGLIYLSDYAYASTTESCKNSTIPFNSNCVSNNWLEEKSIGHLIASYYAILPAYANSPHCGILGIAGGSTSGRFHTAKDLDLVRSSLYLKFNVKIIDGDGSVENPYKLVM